MSIAYAPKYIGTDTRPDWFGLKSSPACDSRAKRQAPSRRKIVPGRRSDEKQLLVKSEQAGNTAVFVHIDILS